MEHCFKYLTIFVSYIFTIHVLINCEEIDNVTLKNNQGRILAPKLPIPHVSEATHSTITNINRESAEGGQLTSDMKKTFNHKPIENESTELGNEIPIIWYKQWTPTQLRSGTINNNHMDLNEAISYPLLNRVPPVTSLPAVYPVYLNKMIPYEQAVNYDLVGYNSPDLFMSPPRPVRSRDEELLAQLSHDAIMQNILPTMPFPYFRRASTPYGMPDAQIHGAHIMAMFPNGKTSGCGVPVLLTCSAKITQGTISEEPIYGNFFNSDPVTPMTYQTDEHIIDSGKEELVTSLKLANIKGNADINSNKYFPIKTLEKNTVLPTKM